MATKSPNPVPKKPTAAELRARRKLARERFLRSRKAGKSFERQLRAVARQVGVIVRGFAPEGVVRAPADLTAALDRYAQLIRPWAQEVSSKMIGEVSKRDEYAWSQLAREVGQELRKEVHNAPTGQVMQILMGDQVDLITSLPLQAAQRVHSLTIEAMTTTSARASEISKEILRTGHVTESRAMLIARTEVARTASVMTQSRAEYVGSDGYIWRTSGDSDVRPLHKRMEGKYVEWGDPPRMEPTLGRYHAGQGPNCRCYAEPVLKDIIT
jgi:SPP1 gp7 family putative phage head morphogenesis protein